MSEDHRNPYVLLGVPFGARGDVAAAAFAKKSRGLRRASDGVEKLTELTWALNQVQAAIADPGSAVHVYRVPADSRVLAPDGSGVFRPTARAMPRRTHDSASERATLLEYARFEALLALVERVQMSHQLPIR